MTVYFKTLKHSNLWKTEAQILLKVWPIIRWKPGQIQEIGKSNFSHFFLLSVHHQYILFIYWSNLGCKLY